MTIRFRRTGADAWFEGETLNISESGVLFRTSEPALNLDGILDMTLEMSALGPRIANITCSGRLVRTTVGDDSTVMAATIDRYHLSRSDPSGADLV